VILTSDNFWLIEVIVFTHAHLTGIGRQIALAAQAGLLPTVLLTMALFYLWAYARETRATRVAAA
jgi:hypothetical protein